MAYQQTLSFELEKPSFKAFPPRHKAFQETGITHPKVVPLSATAESHASKTESGQRPPGQCSCSLHIRSLESRWYWRQNLSCLSLHPQHPALDHAEQMLRDALLSEQMNQQHFHFSTSFPTLLLPFTYQPHRIAFISWSLLPSAFIYPFPTTLHTHPSSNHYLHFHIFQDISPTA